MKAGTLRNIIAAAILVSAIALAFPGSACSAVDIQALNHRVIDAEYSKALGRIITVAATPMNKLHIIDPVSQTDTAVDLPYVPTCVSVGPDGLTAAVGHDGYVSHVDLMNLSVLRTYAVSVKVGDLVLAGNGFAYVFLADGQWDSLRSLNLETGEVTAGSSIGLWGGVRAKLHPNGIRIYGMDGTGMTRCAAGKYDISAGVARFLYTSPYYGGEYNTGTPFISEDGYRLLTTAGNVFRASESQSEDMYYNGDLGDLTLIQHLDHSSRLGKIAAIPGNPYSSTTKDTEVRVFDYSSLAQTAKIAFPFVLVNGTAYANHGKFVFYNPAGTKLHAIMQTDAKAGLLHDFAITWEAGSGGAPVFTISASAGAGGTISPSGTVEVLSGNSVTFTITPDKDYAVSDVRVDGLSVGAVTSYTLDNISMDRTISASFRHAVATASYFPLIPGASWMYQVNGTGTQTMTIAKNTFSVNGVKTAQAQYSDRAKEYYTNDASGIRLHGEYSPAAYQNRAGTLTMTPPVTIAPPVAIGGQNVHSAGTVRLTVPGLGYANAPYSADYTVTGFETITVPAGTFEALKISYSLTVSGSTQTGVLYLGENTGLIGQTATYSGQTTTYDLVSTNSHVRDLAVTGITPPPLVAFTKTVKSRTAPVRVVIQNRSPFPETITDRAMLLNVVTLTAQSLGACANPVPSLTSPTRFPLTIASKGSLTLSYNVTFNCVNDPARTTAKQSHNDYRFTATTNRALIDGMVDSHTFDDVCPRSVTAPSITDPYPDGSIKDRGCGKLKPDGTYGGDMVTDITAPIK